MKGKGLKVLAVGGTALMLACSFIGCSGKLGGNEKVNKEYKAELEEALYKLKTTEGYIVQTYMEAPDGNAAYLEVVKDGGSYTEYPVDADGNITDSLLGGSSGNGDYALADWLDADGNSWIVQTDSAGDLVYYSLPQSYGRKCLSRNVGYFDLMLDSFTEVEKQADTETADIGDGSEEYTLYKCKLPSDVVKEILGMNTYGLYSAYKDDSKTEDNIKTLCGYYIDELNMSLTFSDANVMVAVADGQLRQLTIEVGGLGTRLYVTKSFLTKGEYEVRERPDFTDSKDYMETMREVADYVAGFDTYEEALKAMNNGEVPNVSSGVTKDIKEAEEEEDVVDEVEEEAVEEKEDAIDGGEGE